MRSGPGVSYPIVGALSLAKQVTILEELDGWFRIDLLGAAPAWVSATYVTKVESAATAPTATQNTAGAPALIAPVGGSIINDPLTFTWSWPTPLGADEGFDVQAWKDDQSPAGIAHPSFVVNNGNGTYTLNIPSLPNPKGNNYSWRVRVINIMTGVEIAPASQPESFRYE